MYSQNNEEEFITIYFNNYVGRFLDIGGFHPFQLSNTRKLYELGWKGIYIEPSLICYDSFVKTYHNDENIVLINKAVVSDDKKEVILYESGGDAVSTTSVEHTNKWQKSGVVYNPIKVDTITTRELEESYDDIDFLSIDVESTNFEIFSAFSEKYLSSIKMICIEHDSPVYDTNSPLFVRVSYWIDNNIQPALSIYKRLNNLGFKIITINGENVIFAK